MAEVMAGSVEGVYKELERKQDGRQHLWIVKVRNKASKDIISTKQMKDELGVVLYDQEKILEMWMESSKRLIE